jgi:hypothetical protein
MRIPNKFNGYSKDGIRLYNDPVTMAVVGASAGALMNKKDPLKGALLGATAGFGGGTLMAAGGLGAAGAGSASALGSAGTAAGTATAPTAAFTGQAVSPAMSTIFANPTNIGTTISSLSGPSTGMIPSSLAQTSFMDTALGGLKSAGQFAQQNPVLANQAMQSAQQMMQQPETQFAPAGQVNRGQIQGGDYMSLLNPQQGTVLRPQPISLLG